MIVLNQGRLPDCWTLARSVSMHGRDGRGAFSLIEMLIVVVLIAILAATIIPRFADSTSDAKTSAMDSDLHSLHTNLQLYKAYYGDYPAALSDLTVAGPAGHGPYIDAVPENPFNGSSAEAAVSSVPSGPNATGEGWLYLKATGQVWANCAEGFK
jgi:general secretion pathway protein G